MNVLFVTYPGIGLGRGGLQIQIARTAEALRRRGVSVDLYTPWDCPIGRYDVVHAFSLHDSQLRFCEAARRHGKRVILSPVANLFSENRLSLTLRIAIARRVRGIFTPLRQAHRLTTLAHRIIALNEEEAALLQSSFGIAPSRIRIIPNGRSTWLEEGEPMEPQRPARPNVLFVGSIEPRKNLHTLIKASTGADWTLTVIGGPKQGHETYLEECRGLAAANVTFVGHIPQEDPRLKEAYWSASAFVLPSFSEVQPLVLFEAGVTGVPLIASESVPIAPELRPFVTQFPADDVEALRSAIQEAIAKPLSRELAEVCRRRPTWDDVAGQLMVEYADQ